MKTIMQDIYRSWDVKELMFSMKSYCDGIPCEKTFKSIKRFWANYENGHWVTVFVRRTAHSGLTNSARCFEYGANYEKFTVHKTHKPLTERQAKMLPRLAEPSCGNPNCGHKWDNGGFTNVK